MNGHFTSISSPRPWRILFVVVSLLATQLIAFSLAAGADRSGDPVADDFSVSFYRVGSPKVGELDSVRNTYQQAMADVERLLAWTNSFDGSPIVDRVEVEWDEVVDELEGGKIVKNRYKVKRTFRPKPKPRSSRPVSTPAEPPVESKPRTEIPGGPTRVTTPVPRQSGTPAAVGGLDPNFFDKIGAAPDQDASASSGSRRTVRLRPPSSSVPYSGPRIRVFNGLTGELIQQYNYDANGNRDSGRPVADDKSRGDQKRLVMDESQPKNQSDTGKTTFSYDNNFKKTAGDPNDPRLQRRAELQRKSEEIAAGKASIQSERERLQREQADLDRENQALSGQTAQVEQARQELDRLQQRVNQDRRQIEELQDQYADYAGGGWKRGYNLCPDGSTYDNCTAHPGAGSGGIAMLRTG